MFSTCVDQDLGTVGSIFRWISCRIKIGGPGIAQNVDILWGVTPGTHGPNNLVQICWIHILFHHNNPFGVICPSRTLSSQGSNLSSMSGVLLLYRDHHHPKATRSRGHGVDSLHPRNAQRVEISPNSG